MLDQPSAILAGLLASTVLTPFIMSAWKKMDPPLVPDSLELDSDTRSLGRSIDREAAIAAIAFVFSCAYFFGWDSEMKGIGIMIFFSGIFAIPYLWTVARCIVAGPERTNQYLLYAQTEHGVGVRLAKAVGLLSTYVLVISVAVELFWVG